MLPLPPQRHYTSCSRNSIRSRAWGAKLEGCSYKVGAPHSAELACAAHMPVVCPYAHQMAPTNLRNCNHICRQLLTESLHGCPCMSAPHAQMQVLPDTPVPHGGPHTCADALRASQARAGGALLGGVLGRHGGGAAAQPGGRAAGADHLHAGRQRPHAHDARDRRRGPPHAADAGGARASSGSRSSP